MPAKGRQFYEKTIRRIFLSLHFSEGQLHSRETSYRRFDWRHIVGTAMATHPCCSWAWPPGDDALGVTHGEVEADDTHRLERDRPGEGPGDPAFCRYPMPCKSEEVQPVLNRALGNSRRATGPEETKGWSEARIQVGSGMRRKLSSQEENWEWNCQELVQL